MKIGLVELASVLLGTLLVVNATARFAVPRPPRPAGNRINPLRLDMSHMPIAKDLKAAATSRVTRNDILRLSAIAAFVEGLLGGALILGWRRQWVLFLLLAMFVVFSTFLAYGAASGWPVSECGCVAGLRTLPLRWHLVANGAVIALLSVLWMSTPGHMSESGRLTRSLRRGSA